MYAFGSDLSRAVDTAEAILRYHGVGLVTSQRLREKVSY
jgi:broad specificity phosphatase PhoE